MSTFLKKIEPYEVTEFSNREDWLKARTSFIGASEAAAIFGVSPWASPLSVYASKMGIEDHEQPSPIMELGNALEPHIAARYAQATGHKLRDIGKWTVLRSRAHPFIACTLDRIIEAPGREKDPGDLEMKAPLFLDDWEEAAPLHYQVQGMHQLLVTGFSWGVLAALARSSGVMVRYPFERHEDFIGTLTEQLKEFWEKTQRGEAPSADGSEATAKALQRVFPKNVGGEVSLPGDFEELDAKRLAAIETIKKAEEEKRDAENKIKAAIRDATTGRLQSGVAYSWALVERAAHEVKASSSRVLRRRAAPKGK